MRKIDLTNQKFGKLTVLHSTPNRIAGSVCWLCKCECGNTKEISTTQLRSGGVRSCGCSTPMPWLQDYFTTRSKKDYAGQKFGRLTVVEDTGKKMFGARVLKCKCDCGNFHEVPVTNLVNGRTKSCGCLAKETPKPDVHKHNPATIKGDYVVITDRFGNEILMDLEDYENLKEYYWVFINNRVQAVNLKRLGNYTDQKVLVLWRVLLNDFTKGKKVKYKNGNKKDCRKDNLVKL